MVRAQGALHLLWAIDGLGRRPGWRRPAAAKGCSAGTVLIREGVPVGTLYILLEGHLRVVLEGSGRQIASLEVGEIVGEMSFIDARPPSATVHAASEVVARCAISKAVWSGSHRSRRGLRRALLHTRRSRRSSPIAFARPRRPMSPTRSRSASSTTACSTTSTARGHDSTTSVAGSSTVEERCPTRCAA